MDKESEQLLKSALDKNAATMNRNNPGVVGPYADPSQFNVGSGTNSRPSEIRRRRRPPERAQSTQDINRIALNFFKQFGPDGQFHELRDFSTPEGQGRVQDAINKYKRKLENPNRGRAPGDVSSMRRRPYRGAPGMVPSIRTPSRDWKRRLNQLRRQSREWGQLQEYPSNQGRQNRNFDGVIDRLNRENSGGNSFDYPGGVTGQQQAVRPEDLPPETREAISNLKTIDNSSSDFKPFE